jgi:hypothetical protein
MLALCCISIYGFDIDYSWSFAGIGIENINLERKVNFSLKMFNFNWLETYTGLGLGFFLFNLHGEWPGVTDLLPVEFMWNPFSTRLGRSGIYGTLSIYDQIAWLRAPIIGGITFVNTAGIRYMFSNIPYGRTKEKGRRNYHANAYIYAEYASDKNWRIGLSADVGFLVSLILYPIFYLTEKPIEEGKL